MVINPHISLENHLRALGKAGPLRVLFNGEITPYNSLYQVSWISVPLG